MTYSGGTVDGRIVACAVAMESASNRQSIANADRPATKACRKIRIVRFMPNLLLNLPGTWLRLHACHYDAPFLVSPITEGVLAARVCETSCTFFPSRRDTRQETNVEIIDLPRILLPRPGASVLRHLHTPELFAGRGPSMDCLDLPCRKRQSLV